MSGGDGDKELRYRLFLGCGLIPTVGGAAIYAATRGYFIIFAIELAVVLMGAALTVYCLKRRADGGGNCELPNGSNFRNDETKAENVEVLTNDYRPNFEETDGEKATDSEKHQIITVIKRFLTQHPRRRAIVCSVIFAVVLVVFSLFITALDSGCNVTEAAIVFETVERADGAIFLTVADGAETFAIFGYALQNDLFDRLSGKVDGARAFTVRYTVMDRDQWSGYYRLIDIKDDSGVSYLAEDEVLSARAEAVAGKAAVFGVIALLCGGACGYYTVLAVKEGRGVTNTINKTKIERENTK
jgi:hypothetical protein